MAKTQTPTEQAAAALKALNASSEVKALLNQLMAAQRATETDETWETRTGQKVESAMGYLRMALEAAEGF